MNRVGFNVPMFGVKDGELLLKASYKVSSPSRVEIELEEATLVNCRPTLPSISAMRGVYCMDMTNVAHGMKCRHQNGYRAYLRPTLICCCPFSTLKATWTSPIVMISYVVAGMIKATCSSSNAGSHD